MKAIFEAGAARASKISFSANRIGHLAASRRADREFIEKLVAPAAVATLSPPPPPLPTIHHRAHQMRIPPASCFRCDSARTCDSLRRTDARRFLPDREDRPAIARALTRLRRTSVVRNVDSRPRRAKKVAEAIHAKFPGKLLAYNCSPSCPPAE